MPFWSSDKLTGSQTRAGTPPLTRGFWSSDKLTGSQTRPGAGSRAEQFWSSDKLTGSQTTRGPTRTTAGFGVVTTDW